MQITAVSLVTARRIGAATLAALLIMPSVAVHADKKSGSSARQKSKTARLGKDYSAQLPPIPPKEIPAALASFATHPHFRVEVVASEPQVRDPVALDFDARGRMYVVELPQYNAYAVKGFKGRGSIRLLADGDGDGRFEKSTVFAKGLNYPTAVACYDGGVFVGAAPELLYLKDTDGDGRADVRRVVFTGFGRDKAGEAHLNSFRWSLENRFFVSTSLSGGNVRPTARGSKPRSVRGRCFIFDPRDTSRFQLTSGGGQHGMSMDDWGRRFVCSNSVPAQMLMYDGRYLTRNPYLTAPSAAVNIAPRNKFTRLYRISPNEPWRVLRTRLRARKLVGGSAEGGKPFGFFTGATGITIYRGDAWPAAFRGNLLVGDVANNLVYRARLKRRGLTLVAERADKRREFLASKDIWFRPVQFANAPDGTLYVLDMYRSLIEGAAFLPPDILKHLKPLGGSSRGRIYRIRPKTFRRRKFERLDTATTARLVALLEHSNGWHRDTASRLLYQRRDPRSVKPLGRLLRTSKSPLGRVTAAYSLRAMEALDVDAVRRLLNDAVPEVRIHGLRLAEPHSARPEIRRRMLKMTEDPDLEVRYQLAYSLGTLPGSVRVKALAILVRRDGKDSWMRLAVSSSVSGIRGEVFRLLWIDHAFRKSPHGRSFLLATAKQIGADAQGSELAHVLKGIASVKDPGLTPGIVVALTRRGGSPLKQLGSKTKASTLLRTLVREAKKKSVDAGNSPARRSDAVRTLALAPFPEVRGILNRLLDARQPLPVQQAALETLARFRHDGVAELLLAAWPKQTPSLRQRAIETLLARDPWIERFLLAVSQGKVSRADVDINRVKLLKAHPKKSIRRKVALLFRSRRSEERKRVVARYQKALKLKGDAAKGGLIFKKSCSACHRLHGIGTAIGADLKAIADRGLPSVLLNILEPNREVKPKFLSYVLVTDEGRVITGMIVAENANSVTIRRGDGKAITVLRLHIDEMRGTGLSYMPDGLEKDINVQAMADLLAFLSRPRRGDSRKQ